jgi:peptidoglycan/LPS O-acetylase OafA/YrhL
VIASYLLQNFGITRILYNIDQPEKFLSHLLFIKGESVLWTIGPEIQFYAIFPLLWLLANKRESYLYVFIAITITVLFFFDFARPRGNIAGLPYDLPLFQSLSYFLTGVIFGRVYTYYRIPVRIQSGWFVLALLVIPLLYPKIFHQLTGGKHELWQDVGILVIVAMVL